MVNWSNDDLTLWRFNLSIIGLFLSLALLNLLSRASITRELPVIFADFSLGFYTTFLVCCGIAVLILRATRSKVNASRLPFRQIPVGLLSALLIFLSTAVRQPFRDYPGLWAGFGYSSACASLALAITVAIQPFSKKVTAAKSFRFIFYYLSPFLLISPRLLLFIQPPNGLINLGDTSYHVIDELLAPLAGSLPYSNYTPQYTGVLGWILLPIKLLRLGGESTMFSVILFANFLNVLVPVLVIAISFKIWGQVNRAVAAAAFIALWTVCGSDLGYSTQLREFSQLARFAPSLIAVWFVVRAVTKPPHESQHLSNFCAGIAVGFACLNSADHGLTLAVAIAVAMLIEIRMNRISVFQFLEIVFGSLSLISLYILATLCFSAGPNFQSYLGLRGTALSGTVYASDRVPDAIGPHLLALSIPIMLFALRDSRSSGTSASRQEVANNLVGTSMAVWLLMLAIKFFLFPIAPASATLVIPAFLGGIVLLSRIRLDSLLHGRLTQRLNLVPLLMLLCTALGAVVPTSNVNVKDELKRISGTVVNTNNWSSTPGRPADGYSLAALRKEDDFLNRLTNLRGRLVTDSSIGYFGIFGNTVEVVLGIDNVLGIAAPESMRFGSIQEKLACVPVLQRKPAFVLVYQSRFPCAGYSKSFQLSDDKVTVFVLVNPVNIAQT